MQQMDIGLKQRRGMDWQGKTVLVIGAARSGIAAAELLLAAGAKPVLTDQKPAEAFEGRLDHLASAGCRLIFEADPVALLDHQPDAVILSPAVPQEAPVVQEAAKRGIPCMAELEFASRFIGDELIAVSGTNGKTTTVSLLGEIFTQAGKLVQVAGNVGFPLSAAVLKEKEQGLYVAEVSSFQLEGVDSFHPRIAALLNITPDHLNRHGFMAKYVALKQRLFDNMDAGDTAVLNHDCPITRGLAPQLKARIVWFSRKDEPSQGAFIRDGNIMFRWQQDEQVICAVDELRLPGNHNLENALAAVAVAGVYGVPAPVIRHGLRSFAGVEHRIEFVRELDGVSYFNDSKGTNPEASIRAVEAMKKPTILLAGGFDKEVSFEELACSIASQGSIRQVLLYGQTAEKIAAALREAGYTEIRLLNDMAQAVKLAQQLAEPGSNVLLSPACASFDQFDDYEQRGRRFKEQVMGLGSLPRTAHERA